LVNEGKLKTLYYRMFLMVGLPNDIPGLRWSGSTSLLLPSLIWFHRNLIHFRGMSKFLTS